MAIYRQVQTAYWQDEFVLQLTPEERYFYIYLLTNSKTKQCGIYQLPLQVIVMETGYNQETSEKLLKRFEEYGKIICNAKTKEIGIVNWPRYNPMESPKTRACVVKELKDVKDRTLIMKIYGDPEVFLSYKESRCPIQGVSQEEQEEEKEQAEAEEEEKEEEPARGILPGQAGSCSSATAAGDLFTEGEAKAQIVISQEINIPEPVLPRPAGDDTEGKDDYGDYKCTSIQMQGELLLIRLWNKQKPNPEEVRITADYITKFGRSEVETAFTEAVKYDRKKLAYVETVCEKRKERADLVKKQEFERQKRLEQERKLEEERKSGVGLGLINKVYGDESKE